MLVHDLDSGLIRSANEAACAFFGYQPHEMTGLPARDLFPDTLWPEASAMLAVDHSDTNACWQMLRRDGSGVDAVVATRLSQLEGYPATIISLFDKYGRAAWRGKVCQT